MDTPFYAKLKCKSSLLFAFILIANIAYTQCNSTELLLEISYQNAGFELEGDAIRMRNSTSTAILYCQEFENGTFLDTICISENTSIDIYGYDIVGQNWGEGFLTMRYINDPNDCGPTSDSILVYEFPAVEGMGEMICGAPFDNDVFITNFTTPSVFCPGSEPQCIEDTIFLTTLPEESSVIVDFLDFVTDDGNVTFDFAFDQNDNSLNQIDSLSCGVIHTIFLTASDDDGNTISCDLVIEVECGFIGPDEQYDILLGDTLDNYLSQVKQFDGHNYVLAYNNVNEEIFSNLTKILWKAVCYMSVENTL